EYLIYEDWESCKLFRVQWDSDHLKDFQHTVGDLIVGPPELNFYYGWRAVSTAAAGVLKTGQTRCWDSSGALVECEGTGQDGDIQAGVSSPSPRFHDNED